MIEEENGMIVAAGLAGYILTPEGELRLPFSGELLPLTLRQTLAEAQANVTRYRGLWQTCRRKLLRRPRVGHPGRDLERDT